MSESIHYATAYLWASEESIADAEYGAARMAYMLADHPPLTWRERVTGWRHFEATSRGLTMSYGTGHITPDGTPLRATFAVSWRAAAYNVRHRLDDLRHPMRYRTRRLSLVDRITGWAEPEDYS